MKTIREKINNEKAWLKSAWFVVISIALACISLIISQIGVMTNAGWWVTVFPPTLGGFLLLVAFVVCIRWVILILVARREDK